MLSCKTARWIYRHCPHRDGGLTVTMAFHTKQKCGEENCRKIYNYQKLIRQKINPSLGASSDFFFFVLFLVFFTKSNPRQERTRLKAVWLRKDSGQVIFLICVKSGKWGQVE